MIFIPGWLITAMTFPGYLMQTVARRILCDALNIPVYDAKYFSGTIVHHRIEGALSSALVAFAPLIVNTILCAILFFPVAFTILLGSDLNGQDALLGWAGLSIGMHALPSKSTIDWYSDSLPKQTKVGLFSVLFVLARVVVIVIDILKHVWFDLIYAVAVGMAGPYLITQILMH